METTIFINHKFDVCEKVRLKSNKGTPRENRRYIITDVYAVIPPKIKICSMSPISNQYDIQYELINEIGVGSRTESEDNLII